jgi:hypothetical protein
LPFEDSKRAGLNSEEDDDDCGDATLTSIAVKSTVPNDNTMLVKALENLASEYASRSGPDDNWRRMTYSRAANTIRSLREVITSGKQARTIRGIGEKTADKIQELLDTGSLEKLRVLQSDPKSIVLRLFQTVHGIGQKTAENLYNAGHRTLSDLKSHAALSPTQRFCIQHHQELQQKIPRDEVVAILRRVRAELYCIHPQLRAICVGSFRRMKPFCGDIDILIAYAPDTPYLPRGSKRLKLSAMSPFLDSARQASFSEAESAAGLAVSTQTNILTTLVHRLSSSNTAVTTSSSSTFPCASSAAATSSSACSTGPLLTAHFAMPGREVEYT